jgi:hypothetical protein
MFPKSTINSNYSFSTSPIVLVDAIITNFCNSSGSVDVSEFSNSYQRNLILTFTNKIWRISFLVSTRMTAKENS